MALGLEETSQGRMESDSPVSKGSHWELKPIDTALMAEPDDRFASASKGFVLSFEPSSLPTDPNNDSGDGTMWHSIYLLSPQRDLKFATSLLAGEPLNVFPMCLHFALSVSPGDFYVWDLCLFVFSWD